MINVCLCGFGNLSHAIVASAANTKKYALSVLSFSTAQEGQVVIGHLDHGKKIGEGYATVYIDPAKIIPDADVIIFCVPAYLRKNFMTTVSSYVKEDTLLGAFPGVAGFNEEVIDIFREKNINYFASQRVPYISRVREKGKSVDSYQKTSIDVAIARDQVRVVAFLKDFMGMDVNYLQNFDSVNLTNSNPLLHTARIYSHLKDRVPDFKLSPHERFYEDWTDSASDLLIKMDKEFMTVTKALQLQGVTDLLTHYDVANETELTQKIRHIPSLKDIPFPAVNKGADTYADLDSRYFLEDFQFSLPYIQQKAGALSVPVPVIDSVLSFYAQHVKRDGTVG